MATLNFLQLLIQSSVSQDLSEMILISWFDAQETLLSMFKTIVLLNISVETHIFSELFDE